jgi:hypothetical protein
MRSLAEVTEMVTPFTGFFENASETDPTSIGSLVPSPLVFARTQFDSGNSAIRMTNILMRFIKNISGKGGGIRG